MLKKPDNIEEEIEELPEDDFDDKILDPNWDYNEVDQPIWIDNKKIPEFKAN